MGKPLKKLHINLPGTGYLIQYTNEGWRKPADIMILGFNMVRISHNDLWMRIA